MMPRKIKAELLEYKTDILLVATTPCPYWKGRFIGSGLCTKCPLFFGINRQYNYKYVLCHGPNIMMVSHPFWRWLASIFKKEK